MIDQNGKLYGTTAWDALTALLHGESVNTLDENGDFKYRNTYGNAGEVY